MELKNILSGIEGLKAKGDLEVDITGISNDSREVKPGYLFIAIKGFVTDGHEYINKAIENGAKAILIQEEKAKEIIKQIPDEINIITT